MFSVFTKETLRKWPFYDEMVTEANDAGDYGFKEQWQQHRTVEEFHFEIYCHAVAVCLGQWAGERYHCIASMCSCLTVKRTNERHRHIEREERKIIYVVKYLCAFSYHYIRDLLNTHTSYTHDSSLWYIHSTYIFRFSFSVLCSTFAILLSFVHFCWVVVTVAVVIIVFVDRHRWWSFFRSNIRIVCLDGLERFQ